MKKIIYILALLFTSNISFGQHFDFGVTAGVLASQFDGDKLFGFSKQGPLAGLNWYYNINNSSQLQFDIDYMNIGSNYKDEERPVSFQSGDFTLLSINMHAVSLFVGYNMDYTEYEKGNHRYKATLGLRLSRAFVFNTFVHNVGAVPYTFDNNNITKTFIAPEFRLGTYITPNVAVQASVGVSINDMMLKKENNVDVLRPFYFGGTVSYVLQSKKSKKRRGRRK